MKQPGLFLPVRGGAQRRRRTPRRPPVGAAAPDLPRSPAAAAALFLSCCCCTGRGLDTRLGLLLAARTEFICRLVWVAGGEGGNPPTTGASSRRGGRREPRGGRLAAAGGREGGEDLQAGVLLLPPRRLAREAEEPPAAGFPERWLWGTFAPRPPSPAPPKIPLLKEPRGPARLKPVAAPWQEEPLTLLKTHTRGEAAAGGRAPPTTASHTAGPRRRGQSPRLFYGARGGEGRASGAARRGVGWRSRI